MEKFERHGSPLYRKNFAVLLTEDGNGPALDDPLASTAKDKM